MAITVTTVLPDTPTIRPPVILVHGAANSAAIWTFWQRELAARGWASFAIDLRGHGQDGATDLSHTGMPEYAAEVRRLAVRLGRPPVALGWSMGGLVAMLAAVDGGFHACVGLAPSTPARAIDSAVLLRVGEFGPEEYGITSRDPDAQRAMPDLDREERLIALGSLGRESRLARDQRKAGIVIESLPCPLMIVTGAADRQWPRQRYDDLSLPATHLTADGASHWGLVLNRRVLATIIPGVLEWITGLGG